MGNDNGLNANAIVGDTLSNIYVTGGTFDPLDSQILVGQSNEFVTKYNKSGIKQWTKLLGGINSLGWSQTDARAIAVDSSSNIYTAGETPTGLNGNTDPAGIVYYVSKRNSNGDLLWVRQPANGKTNYALACAVDSLSNIYIAGQTNIALDGQTKHSGPGTSDFDLFIVKYDTKGNRIWTI